ncbi:MAG: alpha/beta fold hydrolase [Candidatus Korobacteraceae bacterium]|jgi:alpha/beta superfamily hydrolase
MKSPSIRSLFLPGAAGRLEALLNAGTADAAYAGLIAHPHPLFGGTMHNKVVYHAMKALNSFGFPVLRFNFRGVGGSQGDHDNGRGEVNDVQVALEWLSNEFGKPIIFTGFSFGAAVGLRAACPDSRVAGLISLGTPVAAEGRAYSYEFLRECSQPKLFVSGENDQFATFRALEELVRTLPDARLVLIPQADHFFTGHLDAMRGVLTAWIEDMLRSGRVAV